MMPPILANPCKHHRFLAEIISYAVWLYFRCSLSDCNVEELLFVRGVIVSYEVIRKRCRKLANSTPINYIVDASAGRQTVQVTEAGPALPCPPRLTSRAYLSALYDSDSAF
jgi:putative transposase